MKKIALLLVCLMLSGCSYLTEFFIYNSTLEPIYVSYQFKYLWHSDAFISAAEIKSFKSFTKIKEVEDQSALRIDSISKTVSCILKPNEALWIGADTNFSLKNEYDAEKLRANLKLLEIEASNHIFSYDSLTVLQKFQTFDLNHVGISVE